MRIELNLGRNCLRYIIRAYGIREIYIPFYSCSTVWQAARQEGCHIKFYHVDENFFPKIEFPYDAYILYINYFGLCSNQSKILANKYKNIIIDNTQAFYSDNFGLASFNSLRKFFKVQNGAYLFINKELDLNFEKDKSVLKPVLIHENYEHFVKEELLLNENMEIKYISSAVKSQMNGIDFEKDKKIRLDLYNEYSEILDKYNCIRLKADSDNIPFCYPFLSQNSEILSKLSDFILLKLWDKDNIIALPLNDINYAKNIIGFISR